MKLFSLLAESIRVAHRMDHMPATAQLQEAARFAESCTAPPRNIARQANWADAGDLIDPGFMRLL